MGDKTNTEFIAESRALLAKEDKWREYAGPVRDGAIRKGLADALDRIEEDGANLEDALALLATERAMRTDAEKRLTEFHKDVGVGERILHEEVMRRRLEDIQTHGEGLEKALEFYADPQTWVDPTEGTSGYSLGTFATDDEGQRARVALGREK